MGNISTPHKKNKKNKKESSSETRLLDARLLRSVPYDLNT